MNVILITQQLFHSILYSILFSCSVATCKTHLALEAQLLAYCEEARQVGIVHSSSLLSSSLLVSSFPMSRWPKCLNKNLPTPEVCCVRSNTGISKAFENSPQPKSNSVLFTKLACDSFAKPSLISVFPIYHQLHGIFK